MTQYVYDEEESQRSHMDVVYEVQDTDPPDPQQWVEAMSRLNSIDDPLARKLVALHRDCGSGDGVCDLPDEPMSGRGPDWGCETTAIVADHYGIAYPAREITED